MGVLTIRLNVLKERIVRRIEKKMPDEGIANSIKVDGNWFVEGRKITHITPKFVVADGYHYDIFCMSIEELINLVETL